MRVHLGSAIILIAVLEMSGCGGSSSAPSAPSAPSIVNVAGLWTASVKITSIVGGECVGVTQQALSLFAPPLPYTLQVTQNGASLTAIATSTVTGNSTNFSGTAGAASIALNATSSTNAFTFGYLCSNLQRRDTQLTAAAINATITGNSGSGTYADTTNVYLPGTQTGVTGGIMTTNAGFTMTR
jgi:hypothetical protein